jgi:hypothetical protein
MGLRLGIRIIFDARIKFKKRLLLLDAYMDVGNRATQEQLPRGLG